METDKSLEEQWITKLVYIQTTNRERETGSGILSNDKDQRSELHSYRAKGNQRSAGMIFFI